MVYQDINNLDHDPKLAEALGEMVVAWSRAETALVNIFACIANINFDMATMACFRIPTFEARTKVIQAMLSQWKPTKYDPHEIEEAVRKLGKLAKTRNHWIHSLWCVDASRSETFVFDFRAPEDAPRRCKPVKAADVQNHVNAVKRRTANLEHLVPYPFYPETS